MNKNKVVLAECLDYSPQSVANAAEEIFAALGGIENFISAGDKVLLKPNLVAKAKPEAAITTHPALLEEIARRIFAAGASEVVICDSPGGLYNADYLGPIYRVSGMETAAKNSGARLNDNFSSTLIDNNAEGVRRGYKLDITDAVLNADKIINIAKLKTHGFTGYTAAAKNLFGAIAGLGKVQMHADHKRLPDFCDFLVDLNEFLKPKTVLHIIDAVVGMERDGPTSGDPKFIGRLIAAQNPYYADFAGVRLMNTDPLRMPLLKIAAQRGKADYGEIEYLGTSVEQSVIKDFKSVIPEDTSDVFDNVLPGGIFRKFIYKNITRTPKVKGGCRACGKCAEHCPQKAIEIKKRAVIDYKKCIKCFCCQELCPFKEIKIKKPLLYRFATRSSRRKNKINKENK